MAFMKRTRFRRAYPLVVIALLGVFVLVIRLFGTSNLAGFYSDDVVDKGFSGGSTDLRWSQEAKLPKQTEIDVVDEGFRGSSSDLGWSREANLPKQTEISITLERQNHLPPKNLDLFPKLADDRVVIVLYVHNRPQYIQVVINSLSKVEGIGETLLIVSHDGYFPEMDKIVKGIRFCQVKQIYAPFSPHLYLDGFPGFSNGDCLEKDDSSKKVCNGTSDQYGNHRTPRIVSLKHHWWWMMNTVWDGLEETRGRAGHILFIEEDHYIYPNAYRNIQLLTALKSKKCTKCYAANLAPSDVNSPGEGGELLIAEKVGNVGYAFNRTVWEMIHSRAKEFCTFDDYNWDITMWATVYPSFGNPVYTLRGSRRSAAHFGKCGLHQGQENGKSCIDRGTVKFEVDKMDRIPNIKPNWEVHFINKQGGYQKGFKGWGGWGDKRDHELCFSFAHMYRYSQPKE